MRVAVDDAERARIWRGRKSAFAAMGHLSSSYIVQDGVVPRTALPQVLKDIATLSEETGIRVANVFHAGDGNLHPLVLFDERVEGEADARRATIDADPRSLHCPRRVDNRRARCGPGQIDSHEQDVQRGRPGNYAAAESRLRPPSYLQPRQGRSYSTPLWRTSAASPRHPAAPGARPGGTVLR